jgi:hypothetical protein
MGPYGLFHFINLTRACLAAWIIGAALQQAGLWLGPATAVATVAACKMLDHGTDEITKRFRIHADSLLSPSSFMKLMCVGGGIVGLLFGIGIAHLYGNAGLGGVAGLMSTMVATFLILKRTL